MTTESLMFFWDGLELNLLRQLWLAAAAVACCCSCRNCCRSAAGHWFLFNLQGRLDRKLFNTLCVIDRQLGQICRTNCVIYISS